MKSLFIGVLSVIAISTSLETKAQKRNNFSQNEKLKLNLEYNRVAKKTIEGQLLKRQKQKRSISPVQNKSGACADTLFYENFEGQEIPSTFTNLDLDGNIDANGRPANWYVTVANSVNPFDTNYAAASSSWFTPFGQANNWLITPAINVCDNNYDIKWKSAPIEGPAYLDGYTVLVSTTDNLMTSFTDTLAVFAEDLTGNGNIGEGIVHTLFMGTEGLLQQWSFSLEAYAGEDIYVAFVHDSDDDNLLFVDDIAVVRPEDFNVIIEDVKSNLEYANVPLEHVKPITDFVVEVKNNTALPIIGLEAELEIEGLLNGKVFAGTGTLSELLGNMTGSIEVPGEVLTDAIDEYSMLVNLKHELLDSNFIPIGKTFNVTDSVYSRDNDVIDGNLSIGIGASGILGQSFELQTGDIMTSVSYYREMATIGDSLRLVLYDMVEGVPNELIASSEWIVETDTSAGMRVAVFQNGPVAVTRGEVMVGIEEAVNSRALLATNTEMFEENKTHVFFNGTWYHNEDFNFNSVYLIRPNFGDACGNPLADFEYELDAVELQLQNFSASSPSASFNWDFGDGNFSNLTNPTHQYTANGVYDVCLTIIDQCGVDTHCEEVAVSRVGLDESESQEILMYPNPADENIQLKITLKETFNLILINSLGQVVYQELVDGNTRDHWVIPVASMPEGVYYIKISGKEMDITNKMMVLH